MKITEQTIECSGRDSTIVIYPIGDCHIGARNCSETHLKKMVEKIAKEPNAYWFGGGDILDCINPKDVKRFDFDTLPDWLFEATEIRGIKNSKPKSDRQKADEIRKRLNNIVSEQAKRAKDILSPIKHKCWGLIEGNHEFDIRKYHNQDIQTTLCDMLGTQDLTDCFYMRINFAMNGSVMETLFMFAWHGSGGGRTAGAEPNHLARMQAMWESADITFRGHSHTFDVLPPKPVLYIPSRGKLPEEMLCKYRWSGNWGCWLKGYVTGQSTYDSRACYPPRPLGTVIASVKPFRHTKKNGRDINLPAIIKLDMKVLG